MRNINGLAQPVVGQLDAAVTSLADRALTF